MFLTEKDLICILWSFIIFGEAWEGLSRYEKYWSIALYPIGVICALFIIIGCSIALFVNWIKDKLDT